MLEIRSSLSWIDILLFLGRGDCHWQVRCQGRENQGQSVEVGADLCELLCLWCPEDQRQWP